MSQRITRAVTAIVVALATFHAVAFVYVATARATFPFDLEWMEGLHLLHAREILAHHALYAAPRAEFVALPYEPLHAIVLALAARVFGLTFGVGRAISIVATLAFALVNSLAVLRETRRPKLALAAGCAAFALFPASGFWLDLVRVDALSLLSVFAVLAYSRVVAHKREAPWTLAAGLYAAFLVKQLAFAFAPVILLAIMRRRGIRSAILCLGLLVFFVLVAGVVGNHFTSGYYRFYTFAVPNGQPRQWSRLGMLVGLLGVSGGGALIVALGWFAWCLRAKPGRWLAAIDGWPLAVMCGLVATIAVFVEPGGANNDVLPLLMFLPVVCALLVHRLSRLGRPVLHLAALALVASQLALLTYSPTKEIPTKEARDAVARFDALLRAEDGPVLVPDHPFAALVAGKTPSYHTNTIWELRFQLGDKAIPEDLRERLHKHEYAVVITALDVTTAPSGLYPEEIARDYERSTVLDWTGPLECPIGLAGTQPKFVYRPRAY